MGISMSVEEMVKTIIIGKIHFTQTGKTHQYIFVVIE